MLLNVTTYITCPQPTAGVPRRGKTSCWVKTNVGRCSPLYNTYRAIDYIICDNLLDSLNAMWLGLGTAVIFFIFGIIFAVKLSKYYRRMLHFDDSAEGQEGYPGYNSTRNTAGCWGDLSGMVDHLYLRQPEMLQAVGGDLSGMVDHLYLRQPEILQAVGGDLSGMVDHLYLRQPEMLQAVGGDLSSMVDHLYLRQPDMLQAVGGDLSCMGLHLYLRQPEMLQAVGGDLSSMVDHLYLRQPEMLQAVGVTSL
ncbi:hypothetical protein BSL78_29822, partial [Apostichopus japonicus]